MLHEIVRDNKDKQWNYNIMSSNPNITCDIVIDNPDRPWDYFWMSINPNITWGIVRDNPDKPWNYSELYRNKNITWDIVRDNPDRRWSYKVLSSNPNITWDIVRDNPNGSEWDYCILMEVISKQMKCELESVITHFKNCVSNELLGYVWHPSRMSKWLHLTDETIDMSRYGSLIEV